MTEVVKVYDTGEVPFTALRGVNLHVRTGEFVGLIGKSGSGKTTLINMITGIDRPTAGEVNVAGTPVHELNENRFAVWRGRTIGVVFQFFQLLPTLTVIENVMLPMDFCNVHDVASGPTRRCTCSSRWRWPTRPTSCRGAVGRAAAARGHRAGARERPADHRGRRADRKPRLQDGRRGLHAL